MSFNQTTDELSYKNYLGTFKKHTVDYRVGRKTLETWDKDSLTEYCNDNFGYILRNKDYTHVFKISKRFLKLFKCNDQPEFEEKVLIPILRKLCIKYGQDFEQVQKRIFKNECISYREDFN